MMASELCYSGKKSRVECCQDRIYIWSISAVFLGALGRGDIDPIVGKHSLKVSFDRVLPFFRNSNILDAYYGRPLLKYLVYFPLTPLVSVRSYVP